MVDVPNYHNRHAHSGVYGVGCTKISHAVPAHVDFDGVQSSRIEFKNPALYDKVCNVVTRDHTCLCVYGEMPSARAFTIWVEIDTFLKDGSHSSTHQHLKLSHIYVISVVFLSLTPPSNVCLLDESAFESPFQYCTSELNANR